MNEQTTSGAGRKAQTDSRTSGVAMAKSIVAKYMGWRSMRYGPEEMTF